MSVVAIKNFHWTMRIDNETSADLLNLIYKYQWTLIDGHLKWCV